MTTVIYCPDCGNGVKLPRDCYEPFENGVGCMNAEEHDDHDEVVMYEKD